MQRPELRDGRQQVLAELLGGPLRMSLPSRAPAGWPAAGGSRLAHLSCAAGRRASSPVSSSSSQQLGQAVRQGLLLQLLVVEPQPAPDHLMHGRPQPGKRLLVEALPLPPERGHVEISGTIHVLGPGHLGGRRRPLSKCLCM